MTKKIRIVLMLVLLMVSVICLISCSSSPEAPEKTAQAESRPDAGAPVNGDHGGMLSGMPDIIPLFTYGEYSTQSEKIDYPKETLFSLYYEKVSMENIREYVEKLKEKGFKVEEDTNVKPGEFSAFGSINQEPGQISFILQFQANGHVDLQYTVHNN